MCNARKISLLVVVLVLLVVATRTFAASDPNASLFDSSGDLYMSNAATAAEAVAFEDNKFIQLRRHAYVVMKFPDDGAAQPDGTDAADLRVATVDADYPASAEILTSENGTDWTSLGVFADTTDLEFNLTKPAMYVKIDQAKHYIDRAYPKYGFDLDAVTALNQELVRYGEITSPGEGENVDGAVTFAATLYNDDTQNKIEWAVRFGDCKAGGDTVLGNVDGYSDPSFFDGQYFTADGDTTDWEAGTYCFVFNPQEDTGEEPVRETLLFTVGEEEESVFCEIRWRPPLKTSTYVMNLNGTLPIKFFLEDCDGNPYRGEAEPVLVVNFLGNEDQEAVAIEMEWKRGTGGYQFHALFRPEWEGEYEAVVTYEDQELIQSIVVIDNSGGKGKPQTEENLTGQEKDKPGKPASGDKKPKGKPAGTPGKGSKKP